MTKASVNKFFLAKASALCSSSNAKKKNENIYTSKIVPFLQSNMLPQTVFNPLG